MMGNLHDPIGHPGGLFGPVGKVRQGFLFSFFEIVVAGTF